MRRLVCALVVLIPSWLSCLTLFVVLGVEAGCGSSNGNGNDSGTLPSTDAGALDGIANPSADGATPDAPGTPPPDATTDAGGGDSGVPSRDAGPLTIVHQFDGETGSVTAYRGKPEMNVAANGTQVGQVTSATFNVYDYSGSLKNSTSLAALVTSSGLNPTTSKGKAPYEPHVVYSPFLKRWIVTVSCAYDCVLVSSGSDAVASTWSGFYLDGNGNDPSMHVAYDANGAYFSEATVSGTPSHDTPYGSTVFAIPNAELNWTTTLNPTHKNKLTSKPLDIMPVIDDNPAKAAGAPAFFLSRTCNGGGGSNCQYTTAPNDAFRWIVTNGTWSGTTFNWTSNHTSFCAGGAAPADQCVRTDPNGTSDLWVYNTPHDPQQPGTTVPLRGVESHRILGAMQQGSHVHVALGSGPCATSCGAHGTDFGADIFMWADIDCTTLTSCTVAQTQKAATHDQLLWPTVGVDANGNLAVFANAVNSTTTYLGIQAWAHLATDASGVLSGPTPVTPGTTPYLCSLQPTTSQTGNPSGVSTTRDPVDPTAFWVTEQYANDTGDCAWNTRIIEYRP